MTIPKLRFKEFCSEYNEYNLGKLLKSYRLGGNYSNSEIKTNFPLIKMGNLNRGSINLSKIEYIPNDEIINDEDRIQLGDLFFNTRNTLELVGKVAIWRNELPVAYYNSNLMRLEFENNFYMNFLLNTEKSLEKLKAIASGTTSVAAIYTKDLLKVKVKVPFVDEQTKIATFLSAVDEKISQLTQKHQLLSQYKQGMMQKLFSQQIRFKADDGSEFEEWLFLEIGDVFKFKQGKQVSIEDQDLYKTDASTRFIRIVDLTSTHEPHRYIVDYSKNDLIEKDDLFMVRYGSPGLLGFGYEGVIANNLFRIIPIHPKQVFSKFSYYLFESLYPQVCQLSSSTTMPAISFASLNTLKVCLPCLEEQTKIANYLSAIDQKIVVVAQQIEQAKQWKKGLLQQMFV